MMKFRIRGKTTIDVTSQCCSMTHKERENFYRNSTLIVDHTNEASTGLLHHDLTKQGLTLIQLIQAKQHELYHLCYNNRPCCMCPPGSREPVYRHSNRILNPAQLDILLDTVKLPGHNPKSWNKHCCCPANPNINYDQLDLTLTRCLLVNFTTTIPDGSPERLAFDELIKFRNESYAHASKGKISDHDYQINKAQIENSIMVLAKAHGKEFEFKQKLIDAAVRPLDETILRQYQTKLMENVKMMQTLKNIEFAVGIKSLPDCLTTDLCDVTVTEGCDAHFEIRTKEYGLCSQWLKDEVQIIRSERFIPEKTGKIHSLDIRNTCLTDKGLYTVSVKDIERQAHLYVDEYFIKNLQTVKCIEGETAEFTCEVKKDSLPACWKKNGILLDNGGNYEILQRGKIHRLSIKNCNQHDAANYTVSINNRVRETSLVVIEYFTKPLGTMTCIEGETIQFECEVLDDNQTAIWYKKGTEVITSDKYKAETHGKLHRLVINNTRLDDEGEYSVKIKNCARHSQLILKEYFTQNIVGTIECVEGNNVELSWAVLEDNVPAVWAKNGVVIQQSTKFKIEALGMVHTLSIIHADRQDAGEYTVIINNRIRSASLNVIEIPAAIHQLSEKDKSLYVEIIKAGIETRYYIRIVIIGENGVGKTCLLRRLLEETIDDVESTDGVDIVHRCKIRLSDGHWVFDGVSDKRKDILSRIRRAVNSKTSEDVNIRDKLTSRIGKYVADRSSKNKKRKRKHEDSRKEYVDFWFDSVYSCRDKETKTENCGDKLDPPVVVVCTGIDNCKDNLEGRKKEFRQQLMLLLDKEDKKNHLRRICWVSNTEPSQNDFDHLRHSIFEFGKEMKTFGEKLPLKWIQLERLLDVIREAGVNILSWPDMTNLSSKCSINDEKEIILFLKYQHTVGSIVFFESIKENIIINQKWLADAFRCLVSDKFDSDITITSEWKLLEDTGKLEPVLIEQLFQKDPNLEFNQYQKHLLNVLELFAIIKKVTTLLEDGQTQCSSTYYMPCMISKRISTVEITQVFCVEEQNCKRSPWLCMDFKFMPFDFFNHILCYYISTYPICTEPKTKRVAIYHGIGVFNLDKTKSKKFILCFSKNTVAMQLWQWKKIEQAEYKNIIEELKSVILRVKDKYEPRQVSYIVKLKCSEGNIHNPEGRLTYAESVELGDKEYLCEDHNQCHNTKDFFQTWFSDYSGIDQFNDNSPIKSGDNRYPDGSKSTALVEKPDTYEDEIDQFNDNSPSKSGDNRYPDGSKSTALVEKTDTYEDEIDQFNDNSPSKSGDNRYPDGSKSTALVEKPDTYDDEMYQFSDTSASESDDTTNTEGSIYPGSEVEPLLTMYQFSDISASESGDTTNTDGSIYPGSEVAPDTPDNEMNQFSGTSASESDDTINTEGTIYHGSEVEPDTTDNEMYQFSDISASESDDTTNTDGSIYPGSAVEPDTPDNEMYQFSDTSASESDDTTNTEGSIYPGSEVEPDTPDNEVDMFSDTSASESDDTTNTEGSIY